MPLSRHTFAACSVDEENPPANTFLSGLNLHIEKDAAYPATGNVAIPYALPSGTNKAVGGFQDGNSYVWLLYNSLGNHRIVRYDPQGNSGQGSQTTILQWSGLSLSPALVAQGQVLDGLLLYFGADGLWHSVNLARAAAGFYTAPILAAEPFALHVVKPPPMAAPVATFGSTTGAPQDTLGIIQNNAYQFAVRWRYADGEETILSPYSAWLDLFDDPASTSHTSIGLTLPDAPSGVNEVEVLVRQPSVGWAVADTLRRTSSGIATSFRFYGVVSGAAITDEDAARPFESEWPGKTGVVANSRLITGDITEGYITPEPNFTVDVSMVSPSGQPLTLHERSTYRVSMQFYDAQGKPFGCSQPRTVVVPAQVRPSGINARQLLISLSSDPTVQNAEIPVEAATYGFLVARNDRTVDFRQGQAADSRAFVGYKRIINDDGSVKTEAQVLDRTLNAHEKLWVDIGNWPAVGLGYVWTPGDILIFLEENVQFPITGQYGDYVEVQWSGKPVADTPLIEIYTPNTVAAEVYYERGQRYPINIIAGQRRYSQTGVTLNGDCFLTGLSFPKLIFDADYMPPDNKQYTAATTTIVVETMVPKYRMVSSTIVTTTTQQQTTDADRLDAENGRAGIISNVLRFQAKSQRDNQLRVQNINIGESTQSTVGKDSGLWLDMGYGGRPGATIPLPLQRVHRQAVLRFCGVKQVGNRINGLSQWDAGSQYDKLPQEQGAVVALSVASQTQNEGSILLVRQERGGVSVPLGRGQIETADGQQLITVANQVLGEGNVLRGGYGCTNLESVQSYGGRVFAYDEQKQEVVRYDRNGDVPLGKVYNFSRRLKALSTQYRGVRAVGSYDPRRDEYWLSFQPTDDLPGATVVFSNRYDPERWVDQMSWVPEAGGHVGNELLTWKAGALHRHRADAPICTFGGDYTSPQVQFIVVDDPSISKRWMGLEIVSQSLWVAPLLFTDTGQASQTIVSWYTDREGIWRLIEGFRRDQNTPGFTGKPYQAMDEGNPLISPRLTILLVGDADDPQPLVSAGVTWQPRAGQRVNV